MGSMLEVSKGRYKIIEVNTCKKTKKRLYELGIIKGKKLKIVKNDKRSPVILDLDGNKLALCRGLAGKIIVKGDI